MIPSNCSDSKTNSLAAAAAGGSDGDSYSGCEVRERLKRHREEVAGKVTVPEKWGKEDLLKDWIDYSAFDRILAAGKIAAARASLAEEGRRPSSRSRSRRTLRVESRC